MNILAFQSFSGQFRTRIQKGVRLSLEFARLDKNFEKFERGPKSEFEEF